MKEKFKIIREGLAVARFGCVMGNEVILPGGEPIRFQTDDEDNAPGGEEFLVKPFRFLSAALTPYRYFDFTKDGVLKDGVPLFDQLTVYANHNADVNEWKGYTQKPVWDDKNDPKGINGLMVLDRTIDANLARGVEIGALRSASVTIWFEYQKSHPDLRGFYDYLGEEVDGEIVRFIVTRLIRAGEVSIVWEGEDPYAKALTVGSEENTNLNQGGEEDMKLTEKFLKAIGLQVPDNSGDISPEELETAVNETISRKDKEIDGLKANAEIGKKHLEDLRQKAANLYKALKGESAKQNYIDNVILKADIETARALVDEFQGGIEETIPLSCPKCGEKLTRQSSVLTEQRKDTGDKRTEDYKIQA